MKDLSKIQETIEELHKKYLPCLMGKAASYIPELAKAKSEHFSISIMTVKGETYSAGNVDHKFTLQSISKPFVYGLALEDHGRDHLLSKVGVEPSGEAFNSIIELEKRSHRPYNPMINSGAIAVSSLIKGKNKDDRLKKVLELFEKYTGHAHHVDEEVFFSEKKTAHRNRAIANLLLHFGILEGDEERIDETLDLYFKQCSILANTADLAAMAATLANGGTQPLSKNRVISADYARDILSLMFTCGMYDTAGEFAYTVGLPAKSGVSGGLLAVVPGVLGIGLYSPLIDEHGHSIRSLMVLKELTNIYDLSVFSSGV